MAEDQDIDQLPAGLAAGLCVWADAVRAMAKAPEFRSVLPALDPDEGFDITIERAAGILTVTFGGLIHDCDGGLDEALLWAERAYTPGWRLRVDSVDGRPVTFTLENPAGPSLGSLSSGFVTLFARWRRRSAATYVNTRAMDPAVARELASRRAEAQAESASPGPARATSA
jgi:hypothetical protein